jgi:hypothetical protein
MKPQILELSATAAAYLYTGKLREDFTLASKVGWRDYNTALAWLPFYGVR